MFIPSYWFDGIWEKKDEPHFNQYVSILDYVQKRRTKSFSKCSDKSGWKNLKQGRWTIAQFTWWSEKKIKLVFRLNYWFQCVIKMEVSTFYVDAAAGAQTNVTEWIFFNFFPFTLRFPKWLDPTTHKQCSGDVFEKESRDDAAYSSLWRNLFIPKHGLSSFTINQRKLYLVKKILFSVADHSQI